MILGISFDTVADNAAFARKFAYPFDLLCDTERAVGLAYGACDAPADQHARRISYLIDRRGMIAKAYPKVKPGEHPAEVLRDLDALPSR